MKAIRTTSTLTRKWSASPRATPATIWPWLARVSFGGTPRSSHVASQPARSPAQSQGRVRVVPDGRGVRRAAKIVGMSQDFSNPAGTPSGNPGPAPGRFDVRQLRRSRDDRMIGGVCGGLGRYVGIDPIIFRIVLAALAIFGGVGLLLYALAWLLIPDDGTDVSELHRLFQGHPSPAPVIAAIVVGVIGVITVTEIAYHRRGRFEVLLIVLAVVAVVALTSRSRGIPPATAVTPPPYGTPPRPPFVTPPPSYGTPTQPNYGTPSPDPESPPTTPQPQYATPQYATPQYVAPQYVAASIRCDPIQRPALHGAVGTAGRLLAVPPGLYAATGSTAAEAAATAVVPRTDCDQCRHRDRRRAVRTRRFERDLTRAPRPFSPRRYSSSGSRSSSGRGSDERGCSSHSARCSRSHSR